MSSGDLGPTPARLLLDPCLGGICGAEHRARARNVGPGQSIADRIPDEKRRVVSPERMRREAPFQPSNVNLLCNPQFGKSGGGGGGEGPIPPWGFGWPFPPLRRLLA